ncbi:hypothetical protein GQR58_003381 [Nymphon striatum]|nr:hypothetical protein GQR58_003381 [Nymphon striatum]
MLDSVKELLLKELDAKAILDLLLKEVDIKDVKKLLLKEINIKEIQALLVKEISVDEIKELLLTEIDVKKLLLKEMDLKELLSLHQGEKPKNLLGRDVTNEKPSSRSDEESHNELKKEIRKEPKKEPELCLPAYDFSLIETLKVHQNEVLSLYELSLQRAKEKKYDAFAEAFGLFTTEYTYYFQKVDEELYGYLKGFVSLKNQVEKKVFNQFISEMKNITLTISSIINQSSYIPVRDDTVDGFVTEFTYLGEMLKDRIKREDKIIYPLYENSRKVVNIS